MSCTCTSAYTLILYLPSFYSFTPFGSNHITHLVDICRSGQSLQSGDCLHNYAEWVGNYVIIIMGICMELQEVCISNQTCACTCVFVCGYFTLKSNGLYSQCHVVPKATYVPPHMYVYTHTVVLCTYMHMCLPTSMYTSETTVYMRLL